MKFLCSISVLYRNMYTNVVNQHCITVKYALTCIVTNIRQSIFNQYAFAGSECTTRSFRAMLWNIQSSLMPNRQR